MRYMEHSGALGQADLVPNRLSVAAESREFVFWHHIQKSLQIAQRVSGHRLGMTHDHEVRVRIAFPTPAQGGS